MQGRFGDAASGQYRDHESAVAALRDALRILGERARRLGQPLLYEPLNRYETNLANTAAGGLAVLDALAARTSNCWPICFT